MYYVYVNDINIAVYDLNPSAKKLYFLYMVGH